MNDEAVLEYCLKRSPDIASGAVKLRTYSNYSSAGAAYNRAIDEATGDILVLAHQDVYLPAGFLAHLHEQVTQLNEMDPDWAVAGAIGLNPNREVRGAVWVSSFQRVLGVRVSAPVPAICVDELLIIVRLKSGVRFDEALPGFHMYGVDVIHTARSRGLESYILDAPVVHHSRPVMSLGGGYRVAYKYMQKKWRNNLPIFNLICTIYPTSLWLTWRDFKLRRRHGGRTDRPEPVGDPVLIAQAAGFENAAKR